MLSGSLEQTAGARHTAGKCAAFPWSLETCSSPLICQHGLVHREVAYPSQVTQLGSWSVLTAPTARESGFSRVTQRPSHAASFWLPPALECEWAREGPAQMTVLRQVSSVCSSPDLQKALALDAALPSPLHVPAQQRVSAGSELLLV